MKPDIIPVSNEMTKAIVMIGKETLAGITYLSISAVAPKESKTPINPPIIPIEEDSNKN